MRDLGAVLDHEEALPHPAGDRAQQTRNLGASRRLSSPAIPPGVSNLQSGNVWPKSLDLRNAAYSVRNNLEDGDPVRLHSSVQEMMDRLAALIAVFAATGAVGDHENADPGKAARFRGNALPVELIVHEQPPFPPHVHPA